MRKENKGPSISVSVLRKEAVHSCERGGVSLILF